MTQPPHSPLAEIAAIQSMNAKQILAKYSRFFTGSQTRCTATLRQEAIYRLQEEHYNLRITDATAAVLNASLEKREERRKGREYKGIHTPLVTETQWATAREVAMTNAVAKGEENRIETVAEFKGVLKCGHCGGAMVPKFSMKNGRRYIYYKCQRDEIRAVSTCPIRAISSNEIERPIWNELARILRTPTFHEALASVKPELADKTKDTIGNLAQFIEMLYPGERSRVVHALIKEIRLTTEGLDIVFLSAGAKGLAKEMKHDNL